jgi:serralysin
VNNSGVTVTDTTGLDTILTSMSNFSLDPSNSVATEGVTLDATADIENLTYTGSSAFIGTGNSLNNKIIGGTGTATNTLSGGTGNDWLIGGAGSDTLSGGTGNDRLTGNGGSDWFVFDSALNGATNVDTITDFATTTDHMLLSNAIFGLGTSGNLTDGTSFVSSATGAASGTVAQVDYNTTTGALLFAATGTSGGQTQFATLTGHPTIAAGDFTLST